MNQRALMIAAAAGLVAGPVGQALGDDSQIIRELQTRIQQLEGEVSGMKAELRGEWLTEQRADEIRVLVQDVLSDADTRSSLLQGGAAAGHDGKFFIGSSDGAFRLNIGGHLQARWIYNSRSGAAGSDDEDVFGFAIRRAKVKGSGHIGDPRIGFGFSLTGDSDEIDKTFFEDYYLKYTYDNGITVQAGRWKQPFARGNLTSSSRQLAVERSAVLEMFNVDRSEGIMLSGGSEDTFKWAFALNNGADGEFSDWDSDGVDFALTGRVDWSLMSLMGGWSQMKDYSAWSGEEDAAFLGAAFHYQEGESDGTTDGDELLLLTLDGSYESNGLGVGAAFYFMQNKDASASTDDDHFGFEVFASYMMDNDFEPFIRYEYIEMDSSIAENAANGDNEVNIITVGFNKYHKKHAAKFSLDLMFVLDSIDDGASARTRFDPSTSLGLLDDYGQEDGQIVLRSQYQLTF